MKSGKVQLVEGIDFQRMPETSARKLSKAEIKLLCDVKTGAVRTHVGSRREAQLKALGDLVKQGRHSYWHLTDAGRSALAQRENGAK